MRDSLAILCFVVVHTWKRYILLCHSVASSVSTHTCHLCRTGAHWVLRSLRSWWSCKRTTLLATYQLVALKTNLSFSELTCRSQNQLVVLKTNLSFSETDSPPVGFLPLIIALLSPVIIYCPSSSSVVFCHLLSASLLVCRLAIVHCHFPLFPFAFLHFLFKHGHYSLALFFPSTVPFLSLS